MRFLPPMRLPSITLAIASSLGLGLSLSLAACGGDDPSIIASWREVPNALAEEVPVADRTVWTFGEDGVLTVRDGGDAETLAYELEGDRLIMRITNPNDPFKLEVGVQVGDDTLIYGTLFPTGAVDGAVGTWIGEVEIDDVPGSTTLTIRVDGTVRITSSRAGGDPSVLEGTWAERDSSLMFSFMTDPQTEQRMWVHRQGEDSLGLEMEKL